MGQSGEVRLPLWLALGGALAVGVLVGALGAVAWMRPGAPTEAASQALPSAQSPAPTSLVATSASKSSPPQTSTASPRHSPTPTAAARSVSSRPPTGTLTVTAGQASGYRNCTTWEVTVINDSSAPVVRFVWAPGPGSYLTDKGEQLAKAPAPIRQSLYLKPGGSRAFKYSMCSPTPYPEGVGSLEFGDEPPKSVPFTWDSGIKGSSPVAIG